MRLIDADALINRMKKDPLYPLVERYGVTGVIEAAPEVDAEPVVRCKDCKFFDHTDFGKGEEYWCKHFVNAYDDSAHLRKVIEDDFCSWGEKRQCD